MNALAQCSSRFHQGSLGSRGPGLQSWHVGRRGVNNFGALEIRYLVVDLDICNKLGVIFTVGWASVARVFEQLALEMLRYSMGIEAKFMAKLAIIAALVDAPSIKAIKTGPASLQKMSILLICEFRTGTKSKS